MNLRIVRTILQKELLDTLRDKRTLIMMLGVPVLLYPALMLIGVQIALVQHEHLEASVSRIAVEGGGEDLAEQWLKKSDKLELVHSPNPREALQNGTIDAILQMPGTPLKTLRKDNALELTILYDGTEFRSQDALNRLQSLLDKVNSEELQRRLRVKKLKLDFATPIKLEVSDVAPPEKTTGNLLGMILPMLMVVMIAIGAFYPAVDLTAGEKERGTFESLLATPATSLDIVTGKFLAVFTLAMCTGILNLSSMAATFALLIQQVRPMLGDNIVMTGMMPLRAFAIITVVMIPLAFFISAIMMSIAVYARSFKEAQNYITPFFLVILLPSSIAALPGVELQGMMQFMPVGNVVLLFKALMTGDATLESIFAVFISTALFAAIALQIAVWLFQREDIILSEDHGLPFTLKRSAFVPRNLPSVGMAMGLLAFVMLLIVYIGSYVQGYNIISGLLITEWGLIFMGLVIILTYTRVNLRDTFQMYPLRLRDLLATLLIALGSITMMLQVGFWHNKFLPLPIEMEEAFADLFTGFEGMTGMLLLLFTLALTPAICEEVLFRGVLLSAVKDRWKPWVSILIIGILFGIFHLSIYRFIPTALLGGVLTYVVLRSGTIYAGMLLHFLNNATALLLGSNLFPKAWRDALHLESLQDTGLPLWVLLFAACIFFSGIVTMERGKGSNQQ